MLSTSRHIFLDFFGKGLQVNTHGDGFHCYICRGLHGIGKYIREIEFEGGLSDHGAHPSVHYHDSDPLGDLFGDTILQRMASTFW